MATLIPRYSGQKCSEFSSWNWTNVPILSGIFHWIFGGRRFQHQWRVWINFLFIILMKFQNQCSILNCIISLNLLFKKKNKNIFKEDKIFHSFTLSTS
jgi:hypothetical protein